MTKKLCVALLDFAQDPFAENIGDRMPEASLVSVLSEQPIDDEPDQGGENQPCPYREYDNAWRVKAPQPFHRLLGKTRSQQRLKNSFQRPAPISAQS